MNRWPGVSVHADDIGTLVITVERPEIFFRKRGKMPETVTVATCLPPCQDATPKQLAARIRARSAERERDKRAAMVTAGHAFLGVQAVLDADPDASPTTPDPLFQLDPHIACKDKDLRISLLARRHQFWSHYRTAMDSFLAGVRDVLFPWGTLKMVLDLHCRAGPPDENPTLGALALH